jgi:hypothetical protein
MNNLVTINLTQEIYDNLESKKYSYLFDFTFKGITYNSCILYYGIGNILYLKAGVFLPRICKIDREKLTVKAILDDTYLEIII